MSSKTKAYIAGISIILASIAGCTYNIISDKKPAAEAITESVSGIQEGISTIKNADATQQK